MKKLYYLSTCDTCQRILKELKLSSEYYLQDIKREPITLSQLDEIQKLTGSYESLFSKRARLYKERDLKNKSLKEEDYKGLILEHYTFLKRPVLIIDNNIFVGNAKKTIETAKTILSELKTIK